MANRLLCSAIFLSLSSSASLAEMSKDVSWSAGSFFAAAVRCEEHDQIRRGQTIPLMRALNRYLSPNNKKWFQAGFANGTKVSSVYLAGKNAMSPGSFTFHR
jgi:hypothetical protein